MKLLPTQSIKTDAYNACTFVCKAAVVATAAIAAYVALQHFLPADAAPDCRTILKGLEQEETMTQKAASCFIEQQQAIGSGTPEICREALTDYHPSGTYTLEIVNATGGVETFCNLPSVRLEDRLESAWNGLKDTIHATEEKAVVRGVDGSYQAFIGLKTNRSLHTTSEKMDGTKREFNSDFGPIANIYYHAYGNTKRAWALYTCFKSGRCDSRNLEDSDIVDLGRLIQGERVCKIERKEQDWGVHTNEDCLELI